MIEFQAAHAAQNYSSARPATAPEPQRPDGPGADFAQAASGLSETIHRGEATAQAAMVDGADPHALVQALAETELAVETAVTMRDRVVEAYQEILRMPV